MSDDGSATILLRDVPGDVVRELEARARANYRSRYGELMAILVAVCRGHIVFPAACAVGTEQGAGQAVGTEQGRAGQAVGTEQGRAAQAVGAGQGAGVGPARA